MCLMNCLVRRFQGYGIFLGVAFQMLQTALVSRTHFPFQTDKDTDSVHRRRHGRNEGLCNHGFIALFLESLGKLRN